MRRLLPGLLLAALAYAPALAQTSGIVKGTVTDTFTGQPVEAVTVTADSSAVHAVTKTDQHGSFIFTSLPPGRVNISVTKDGYLPFMVRDVCVEGGTAKYVTFKINGSHGPIQRLITTFPPSQC